MCQVTDEDFHQVNHQTDEELHQVNHQSDEEFHQVTHQSDEDCNQVNHQTDEDFHQVDHQSDEEFHQVTHQSDEDFHQVNYQTDEDCYQVNHHSNEDCNQVSHQSYENCHQVNHQTDEDYNQVSHQNDEDCCVSVRSLETKTWSQKEELISTMNKEKQEISSNTMNSKNNEDGSPVVSGNQVILSTRHLEQFTSPPPAGVLVQVGMRDMVNQSTESSVEAQDTPNLTRSQNEILTFTSFSKEPSDLCPKSCVSTEESSLELRDKSGQEISSINDEICLSDFRLKDENLNVCQDAEPLRGSSRTQIPRDEAVDHTAKLENLSLSSRQQINTDISASVSEKEVTVGALETEDIGSAKSGESFLKVETTNLSWSEDSSTTDDSISDCVNMELISNSNPNVNQFFHKSSSFTLEVSRQPPDGHEFPPKYSEPSILTTPSGGEDSGVFLDDHSGDPSQGSGPFHGKHGDKNHATELVPEVKTMKQTTYCVLNGTSKNELPKDVMDYEKSINKKRSPTPPPKPFVSPSFNPKNQPLQLSSSSLVEDNTFDRTIKKLTESSSDEHMKYISSGDIELVQNRPGGSCEKQKFTDQTSCKHIDMKQKNHENLKLSSNFYHSQFNHIPVSVKDRIAMFSRAASDTSVVPSDTTQKASQSSEQPEETVTSKPRELYQSFEQPEEIVTSKSRELSQSSEQPEKTVTSKTGELSQSFEQPEGTISSKPRELYQSFKQPEGNISSKTRELHQFFEQPKETVSSKPRELYQSFEQPKETVTSKIGELSQTLEQPEGTISSKPRELYQSFEQPEETVTSRPRELYQSFEQPEETVTSKSRELSQYSEQPEKTVTSKIGELSQSFEQPEGTISSKPRELYQSFKQPEGTISSKTRELHQFFEQPKETVSSKPRELYQSFEQPKETVSSKTEELSQSFEQPEGTISSKTREVPQSFEQPKETATSKSPKLSQSFEQPKETVTSKTQELSQCFEKREGIISFKTPELYQSFEQPKETATSKTRELSQSFEQPEETVTSKSRELSQSFEQLEETVTSKTRELSQSFEQPKETVTSKTRELSQSFEQPEETVTSKSRELSQSFEQLEETVTSKTRELSQSFEQPKETVTSKTRDQYLFYDSGKNIGVKNQHMGSNVGNEKQYIGTNEKAVDVSGAPLGKEEKLVKKNWNFVNETCPPAQSTENSGLEQSTKKEGFLSGKYKLNTSHRSKPSSSLDKDHQSSTHLGNFGVSCSEINMTSSRSQEDLLNRPSNWNFLSLLQKASKNNGPKFKGLVIPDRPISTNSAIKSLPTIASKTAINSKPEPVKAFANQMWKNETIRTPEKTKSLPRDLNIISRSLVVTKDVVDGTSNQTLLSEPPWKSYNPSLPKYSPAFKRRSLQLPRSNVTSVSPTPPSSLTSPASPSSISSSNNSSLGITCPPTVTKQSVFQFSLSHSKPVTPVLPEKPTMPPAPVSSDSEGKDYEQSTGPIISLDDELEKQFNSFSKQTKSSLLTASSSEQNVNFMNSKHRNSNNPCPIKHQKQSPQFSNSKNSCNSSKLKYNLSPLDQRDASSSASNPVSRTDSNGSRDSTEEVKDASSLRNVEVQGKFLAKPVCIDIGKSEATLLGSVSEGENNSENVPSFPPTVFKRQSLVGDKDKNYTVQHDSNQKCPQNGSLSRFTFKDRFYFDKVESDDDSLSTVSQITEDSRQTVDGSVSDTASDSLDHSVDAEFKPRLLSQQKTVLRRRQEGPSDESKNFRALAERWEQKSFDGNQDIPSPPHHPVVSKRHSQTLNTKFPPSLMPKGNEIQQYLRRNSVSNQFTNSTTASDVKMRESRSCGPRPTSLIEERDKKKVDSFWSKRSLSNTLFTLKGESTDGKSVGSKDTFNGSRESLDELGRRDRYMSTSTRSMSVSDILKNFENKNTSQETSLLPKSKPIGHKSSESCSNLYNRYEGRKISDECSSSVVQFGSRDGPKGSTSNFKCNSFGLTDVNSSQNFNSYIHLPSDDCTNTITFPDNRQSSEFTNTSVQCVNARARGKPSDNPRATSLSKDQSTSKSSYPVFESGNLEVTETRNTLFSRQPKRYLKPHCDKPITADKPAYPRTCDNGNCMPSKTGSVQTANKRNSDILDFRSTSSRDKMHSSQHKRFSSVDSSVSEIEKNSSLKYQSAASDHSESRITLSSTISLEDRQQMLEEANRCLLEEPMSDDLEVSVVVIQRKSQVSSIGVTLAGGADYEVKEVTIHKVIAGSLAERIGQIKKGDRVLSINSCNLKGLTHQKALDILKAPRKEVVLVLARKRSTISRLPEQQMPCVSSSLTNGYHSVPDKQEQSRAEPSVSTSTKETIITVELQKDKTGIGFSLDGGKNSPVGDRPLTIKKVFKGGDTDRLGLLKAGDEILSLNNQPLTGMTRTEAWNFMKKLPEGQVSVTVKQR